MKKIISIIVILLTITANIFNAQSKKEKKFEEYNNYIPTNSLGIQMKKYYNDTKLIILSHEKELGEENLNLMLNFNRSEYGKAVKSNNSSRFLSQQTMSQQTMQASNTVYSTNLISKLDLYKVNVLEKLDEVLQSGKN